MQENNQKSSDGVKLKLKSGLYVTATPIGNLGDMTERGKDILRRADAVACEDTRVTAKLLSAYGINVSTFPYHEHNAAEMRPRILDRIERGEAIALVSDAGTPMISDPGFKLVEEARARGLYIDALPGASAVTTALMLSGLPTDKFMFYGFLPVKEKARATAISDYATLPVTMIFYESPNRVVKTLEAMLQVYGPDRPIAVCRELTKLHQEVVQDGVQACLDDFAARDRIRGEIVIVVAPGEKRQASVDDMEDMLWEALTHMRVKEAAGYVSDLLGLPKRDVYQRALALKDEMKGN